MTSSQATAGVVIPIRAFDGGKERLSPHLDRAQRAALFRSMAGRVADAALATAAVGDVVVVTSAPEVRDWADERALEVVDDPGTLDEAAAAGAAALSLKRAVDRPVVDRVVVVHADLPLIVDLVEATMPGAARVAVVVPCRHGDGTPVLSLPADVDFRFSYGPGSFARHVAEARRLGLEVVELVDDHRLRHDVDSIDDLHADVRQSLAP